MNTASKQASDTVTDAAIDHALDVGEVRNQKTREFVHEWANITSPKAIEVISAADDERLLTEALEAEQLLPTADGNYYARSHILDTARSESRTVVATSRPDDQGVYNNWRPSAEVEAEQRRKMRGASAGKTMYVVPYLMAAPGTPLQGFGAGVQLTDDRTVVLQMIRMARVGIQLFDDLEDPGFFVRGVHVTGDLSNLQQGTSEDQRLFATIADQRLILHFGSAYGGNALLGKIAHGLRQASYDGWASGKFLAEQFMLMGIVDTRTGRKYHVCGGFPSASGKTNLAMTLPPHALEGRYRVEFLGDDITWLRVGDDGRLYGMNPENGVFGVARDTNASTNPAAYEAIGPNKGVIFTNVARNDVTGEVWWEGRTPQHPADTEQWRDWTGALISERDPEDVDKPWAHPNSRFTTSLANIPIVSPEAETPGEVAIDAIIFGGRTRDREPLIRAFTDLTEGVYDGLTLGAEATFAAEGIDGQLRYDPMSMRPFMSLPEGVYAEHWMSHLQRLEHPPVFAHVNWFQRDSASGRFLWPGFRENLRALLWLLDYRDGSATGRSTPVGSVPTPEELNLAGLELTSDDLEHLLEIDNARWRQEMQNRREHLEQFTGLPEEIFKVHDRIAADLEK